ncbi:hypothetical protein [Anaerobiospirillum sp. NML120449]|uniref:hypothetical protein n=1 Tax=Anaerobiospirillum sp. NML120449 TaxID=2932817 RepID=UPI001FF433DB|nr:hypothetical protein [Anaerobiospirillum sp. NML120449]MCK0526025.1 hypothetical protein [Anaerobiospirillum sp. NML120449]
MQNSVLRHMQNRMPGPGKTACPAPAKQPSIMLIQPDTGWDLQVLSVTMTILILAW